MEEMIHRVALDYPIYTPTQVRAAANGLTERELRTLCLQAGYVDMSPAAWRSHIEKSEDIHAALEYHDSSSLRDAVRELWRTLLTLIPRKR